MEYKIHFGVDIREHKSSWQKVACGRLIEYHDVTYDFEKVTCRNCKRSRDLSIAHPKEPPTTPGKAEIGKITAEMMDICRDELPANAQHQNRKLKSLIRQLREVTP